MQLNFAVEYNIRSNKKENQILNLNNFCSYTIRFSNINEMICTYLKYFKFKLQSPEPNKIFDH